MARSLTFDPAADFLLTLDFPNLFDHIGTTPVSYECRGCRERVSRSERKAHHTRHKRDVPKARAKAAAASRAANLALARKAQS